MGDTIGQMKRYDHLVSGLRKKGFKITPQRKIIIDILSNDESHPGAESILKRARQRSQKMSLSTVYSTLTLLKKEGLIRELEFNNMDNRYEANTSDHFNLVCLGCRKIFDFKKGKPVPTEKIQRAMGFVVTGMRFEYHGYCKECNPTCCKRGYGRHPLKTL